MSKTLSIRRSKIENKTDVKRLTIALAGNTNVGKSVIFNQITGLSQTNENWPGKTVERVEGSLQHMGQDITVVDLPGIYSLSTFSPEEIITREYIAREKPDVIINVVGASVLERNLFFTLQLIELGVPMVICLNQMDLADSQGIDIDTQRLEKIMEIPVVRTVATKGIGINDLIEKALEVAVQKSKVRVNSIRYSDNIEAAVTKLTGLINTEKHDSSYPPRWLAIKLLENDDTVRELINSKSPRIIEITESITKKLEDILKQPVFITITAEKYAIAGHIVTSVTQKIVVRPTFTDRLERLSTQKFTGYLISFGVIAVLLLWTFLIGNLLSNLLTQAFSFFHPIDPEFQGSWLSILWNGLFGGLVTGLTLVIPYVIPFYLMLAILEDSGILTRVAFMLDSLMHQMGLHGKAIVPLILGFGCNVPAIYSTRILNTRRERFLASFAITFAPCSARTIIILSMVAVFVNVWWAIGLYAIDLFLMFAVVKIASLSIPGKLTGLIMEMHPLKAPSASTIFKQTWARTKSLVFMVFPVYMIASAGVQLLYVFGILNPVNNALSFLTVSWLGLPILAGVLLIFGAARKELIILAAVAIFGTDIAAALTPTQIIVLALVSTIYPCFATVGALTHELGWKSAWAIIGLNLGIAFLISGIVAKVLGLVM